MPRKQHLVRLSADERRELRLFVHRGYWDRRYGRSDPSPTWAVQRARILLRADVGPEGWGRAWTDQQIAEAIGVTPRTVA